MNEGQPIRGALTMSPKDHKAIGSSGSGFEDLVNGPLKTNIPLGQQMSQSALEAYYAKQLSSVRANITRPQEARDLMREGVQAFGADLDFLKGKGIDVSEALELIGRW